MYYLSKWKSLLCPQFKLIYSTTDTVPGWLGTNMPFLFFRDAYLQLTYACLWTCKSQVKALSFPGLSVDQSWQQDKTLVMSF